MVNSLTRGSIVDREVGGTEGRGLLGSVKQTIIHSLSCTDTACCLPLRFTSVT